MRKIYLWAAGIAAAALTLVASAGAAQACGLFFFESELPTKLKK